MSKYKIPKCRVRVETYNDGTVRHFPEAEHKLWPFPPKWHCHTMMYGGYATAPEYSQLWAEQIIDRFIIDYQERIDSWIKQDTKIVSYYGHPKEE